MANILFINRWLLIWLMALMSTPSNKGHLSPQAWGQVKIPKHYVSVANAMRATLTVGARRSYGDVCELSGENTTIFQSTSQCWQGDTLNHFLSWQPQTRVIRVESGVSLGELCRVALRYGCFPPVIPGTQYATVGGAIANDVHGKNHHEQGSFGCHVLGIGLWRHHAQKEQGTLIELRPDHNSELFYATIGGLGLTGTIVWADIQLMDLATTAILPEDKNISPWLSVENFRFNSLDEFFTLDREHTHYPYTVAWVDCSSSGFGFHPKHANRIRGIYSVARHLAVTQVDQAKTMPHKKTRTWPMSLPFSWVNPLSLLIFNRLYWAWPRPRQTISHYQPFFFPLDGVLKWNRLYGKRGFYQYQCVIPKQDAPQILAMMLKRIRQKGEASPLVVLKRLGEKSSGGLMSFCREGYTLALDFPNRGTKTLALLNELDAITQSCGGAVYPAKDARMSAQAFHHYYPQADTMETWREPHRISDFWLRVREGLPSRSSNAASITHLKEG